MASHTLLLTQLQTSSLEVVEEHRFLKEVGVLLGAAEEHPVGGLLSKLASHHKATQPSKGPHRHLAEQAAAMNLAWQQLVAPFSTCKVSLAVGRPIRKRHR
jgi:hypothetical protein